MSEKGEGPGSAAECWCGQPPVARFDPTHRAGSGWLAPDDGGPARYLPIYRCARHLGQWRHGRSAYVATILVDKSSSPE